MRTEDLRVQALKNPLGINENPVFSWQLVSDKKDEKNERQTAYRILVSESEASLINETGMLWDSGVVKESRCFGILYQGKKLHSAQKAYWKVMVWDGEIRHPCGVRRHHLRQAYLSVRIGKALGLDRVKTMKIRS